MLTTQVHKLAAAADLEAALEHERDYDYDYFGLRTLLRSYLHKGSDGSILERSSSSTTTSSSCTSTSLTRPWPSKGKN